MCKRVCLVLMMTSLSIIAHSQDKDTISMSQLLNEVHIKSINAGDKTPVSFTNIQEEELESINIGQDLPYLISMTPSIVTSSDAGAGIGYTYMTIRGSDASRINVTINGIPINDSESQGVWWVNMPDFTSSVSNIQIQRGVGTSTNGGSAFGATVNLETNKINKKGYVSNSSSIGSFNSIKNSVEFGTGLINEKFSVDGRMSSIISDGYIDRASSNLRSFYLSGGYYGKNSIIQAIIFSGHERTYQAWYGVPQQFLDSIPTFNPYNYENEVDDYTQTHTHLHYKKQFENNLILNLALHYTKGDGFYEQYIGTEHNSILYNGEYIWGQNNLSFYGLEDTITNFVRRKWLDNNFYGTTFSLNHSTNKMNLILGGAANSYNGSHFGRVVSTEFHDDLDYEYYRNDAVKNDMNIYLKADYAVSKKLNTYLDLQGRIINYIFEGFDDNAHLANQTVNLGFFNPKAGTFYSLSNNSSIYASFSIGNKEPNRDDYVESSPDSRPKHETLYDTELGWKYKSKNISLGINLYNMDYKNQLIKTGEINNVGASVHSNIDKSYRRGLEAQSTVFLTDKISWSGNVTLSKNKIVSHKEFTETWDYPIIYPVEGYEMEVVGTDTLFSKEYENTDISFSPNIIAKSQLNYIMGDLEASWVFKYIGKQHIDNTQSEERMLDDYAINNLIFLYRLKFKNVKSTKIILHINNLMNHEYSNRAWTYRFISNGWNPIGSDPYINSDADGYNMTGYFPQAGRHYMLGVTLDL